MRVALVHTSPKREVVKGTLYPRLNCVEGLGVAYLAAYLEKDSHEVKIISEMDEVGKDTWNEIVNFSPEAVGFYSMTSTFPRVMEYAQRLKALDRNILTIIGGDHISSDPYNSLSNGIDFGVKGEGERTLSELLTKIERKSEEYCDLKVFCVMVLIFGVNCETASAVSFSEA